MDFLFRPEFNARYAIHDLVVGLGDIVDLGVQEDWLDKASPLVRGDPERDDASWPPRVLVSAEGVLCRSRPKTTLRHSNVAFYHERSVYVDFRDRSKSTSPRRAGGST